MQATHHPKRAIAGFTLVEVMIVVAIIAVLTAIAVPSYLKYLQTSRRSDAWAALTLDQGILERCYAQTFDYYNASTGTNCGTFVATSPGGYYAVVMDVPAPSSTTSAYLLTAAPSAGSPQANDTQCTTISLSSTNGKQATGSGPNPSSTCWQQ